MVLLSGVSDWQSCHFGFVVTDGLFGIVARTLFVEIILFGFLEDWISYSATCL